MNIPKSHIPHELSASAKPIFMALDPAKLPEDFDLPRLLRHVVTPYVKGYERSDKKDRRRSQEAEQTILSLAKDARSTWQILQEFIGLTQQMFNAQQKIENLSDHVRATFAEIKLP